MLGGIRQRFRAWWYGTTPRVEMDEATGGMTFIFPDPHFVPMRKRIALALERPLVIAVVAAIVGGVVSVAAAKLLGML